MLEISHKYYAILSETGVGKTMSFTLCSMEMDSRFTFIFASNSTIKEKNMMNMKKEILEINSNAIVYYFNELKEDTVIDYSKNNYIITNYEKGQLNYSRGRFDWIVKTFKVDLLIFDEIQNLKKSLDLKDMIGGSENRYNNVKRFRLQLEEKNPELRVIISTASIFVNTLAETLEMMKMWTGKEYELSSKNSFKTCAKVSLELFIDGIREIKDVPGAKHTVIEIDGESLKEDLEVPNISISKFTEITLELKIKHSPIKKGSIIYIAYQCGGITKKAHHFIKKHHGLERGAEYSGKNTDTRNDELTGFINGYYDYIIISKAAREGIDGFQKRVGDINQIWISYPDTAKDKHQIVGRTHFRGYENPRPTEIFIPSIVINGVHQETREEIRWSYDLNKHKRVTKKETYSDFINDRSIKDETVSDYERKNFKECINLLHKMDFSSEKSISKKMVAEPLGNNIVRTKSTPRFQRTNDIVGQVHFMTSKGNPENIRKVHQNKENYIEYINSLKLKRKSDNAHFEWISSQIDNENGVVGDIGCGENIIKDMINNPIKSFDTWGYTSDVIECNIVNLPIPDNSLDYGVYSLSMEQSRGEYKYINEAHRVIKTGGKIIIVVNGSKDITRFIESLNHGKFKEVNHERSDNSKLHYITAIKQ